MIGKQAYYIYDLREDKVVDMMPCPAGILILKAWIEMNGERYRYSIFSSKKEIPKKLVLP